MNIELLIEILSYWAFISVPLVVMLIIGLLRKK